MMMFYNSSAIAPYMVVEYIFFVPVAVLKIIQKIGKILEKKFRKVSGESVKLPLILLHPTYNGVTIAS